VAARSGSIGPACLQPGTERCRCHSSLLTPPRPRVASCQTSHRLRHFHAPAQDRLAKVTRPGTHTYIIALDASERLPLESQRATRHHLGLVRLIVCRRPTSNIHYARTHVCTPHRLASPPAPSETTTVSIPCHAHKHRLKRFTKAPKPRPRNIPTNTLQTPLLDPKVHTSSRPQAFTPLLPKTQDPRPKILGCPLRPAAVSSENTAGRRDAGKLARLGVWLAFGWHLVGGWNGGVQWSGVERSGWWVGSWLWIVINKEVQTK
jgi:hypothetical protein